MSWQFTSLAVELNLRLPKNTICTRKAICIPEEEIFDFGSQNGENFASGIQNPGLWNPQSSSKNPTASR